MCVCNCKLLCLLCSMFPPFDNGLIVYSWLGGNGFRARPDRIYVRSRFNQTKAIRGLALEKMVPLAILAMAWFTVASFLTLLEMVLKMILILDGQLVIFIDLQQTKLFVLCNEKECGHLFHVTSPVVSLSRRRRRWPALWWEKDVLFAFSLYDHLCFGRRRSCLKSV